MSLTLTHVSLFVQDMQAMLKFYQDTMGLQVLETSDGYAALKAGDNVKLSFFDYQKMEQTIPLVQPSDVNGNRCVIEFRIDGESVDAWSNKLRREGVQLITNPTNYTNWGIRSLFIQDPEGNLINLYEPLNTQGQGQQG
ncbi:MAG TPA: VOC family protein [Ktedonobacteraceae bacterium]|nr:VOC family protein [Ktedonobacteraceae bacterium]